MSALEINALERAGAEVFGCDLASLSIGDADQISAAFAAYGLLVFRDQVLDESDLATAAATFGVAAEERGPIATQGQWHAGATGQAKPPLGALEAVRGNSGAMVTHFASTYVAFDELSTATQRALEGLQGIHTTADGQTLHHPLVIRHPLSGRKTLYANPSTTVGVDGMGESAGIALLNELFEHGQREQCVVSVEWEPGTVVLWDSRAFWRFDPMENDISRFVTCSIAGAELKAAIPADSSDPSLVQRAGATLAGGIITAAMTGIAEVIEPERARPDVEIVSEAPEREPLDGDFDFGDLPPLD